MKIKISVDDFSCVDGTNDKNGILTYDYNHVTCFYYFNNCTFILYIMKYMNMNNNVIQDY